MSDARESLKQAKAEAAAAKAKEKSLRPWFKKKRFIVPIALLVLIGISRGAVSPAPSANGNAKASSDSSSTTSTESTTASNEDWYASNYPSFKATDFSGKTDDVVTLPAGASSGMLTATYKGSSNFSIEVLDSNNKETDLAVNTIGAYSGTTAFGISAFSTDSAKLKVTASGSWTLHIAPFAEAPSFEASGHGDSIFKYEDSSAPTWKINHTGSSNFSVTEVSDSDSWNLLVNEIGHYTGTVPADAGPALVIVTADGNWSFTN